MRIFKRLKVNTSICWVAYGFMLYRVPDNSPSTHSNIEIGEAGFTCYFRNCLRK
jgi:predicted transcriptional regulator